MRITAEEFRNLNLAKSKKSKYKAEKVEIDGIVFDSKAEAEMYQLQKADKDTLHIDVHPTLTLPGGIRYKPDFIVWKRGPSPHPIAIEVKGFETQDFQRVRKLFDQFHPLRPLQVYRKTRKGWENV